VGKGLVRRARKGIEEVVLYALGHRIRIQILVALNEGIRTTAEISQIVGVPPKTLRNHLRRMVEEGSIEVAEEVAKGNVTEYKYRSVVVNAYTAEEFERLPFPYRQNIVGAILHSGIAEVLAGFPAGKLAEPRAHVYWDWYNVDEKGRDDADALTHRYLRGLREIEEESKVRAEARGARTASMLLNLFVFKRPREGSGRPHRFVAERQASAPPIPAPIRWRSPRRFFGWGDHRPPSI
jgi:DNA-binding transcriptional ArsR family regulator